MGRTLPCIALRQTNRLNVAGIFIEKKKIPLQEKKKTKLRTNKIMTRSYAKKNI